MVARIRRVRASVRARVRACMRVCVRACVPVCVLVCEAENACETKTLIIYLRARVTVPCIPCCVYISECGFAGIQLQR